MAMTILEATRFLLRSSAGVYYSGLSPESQAAVKNDFFALEKWRQGRISFDDFMEAALDSGPSLMGLFRFLDADRSGFLEFNEFITLQYMNDSGIPVCAACGNPIIVGRYSCKDCAISGTGSFDICLSCYASKTHTFYHEHSRASFEMLAANNKQSPLQCSTCGSNMSKNDIEPESESEVADPYVTYVCDSCNNCIIEDHYQCKECKNMHTFDLCLACYSSPPASFFHDHLLSSFKKMKHAQIESATSMLEQMFELNTTLMQMNQAANVTFAMHRSMISSAFLR